MALLAPASRLGPYEVVCLLGSGAMGEVYKARDSRLGRYVAVKVLSGLAVEDADRVQRFRQEAHAASALNHPNLLLVHDIGELQGILYLVSELIEGPTLRELLEPGALPVAAVLDYGAQIARGLEAAHLHAVVHRDLKPENVMVTPEGRAKIVDFGLAKLDAPLAGGRGALTATGGATLPGVLLGTVAYMAPERIRGEEVDPRSDVFSLGTMLFEMAEGARPFAGSTSGEVVASILRDPAPAMPSTPAALARVVRRCLEKSPDARYQSAGELAADLEALQRDLGAAVPRITADVPGAGARTIAVLPFANVGADAENEYFSDGLAEELIHQISRVRGLQVVAWSSAAQLKGKSDDVQGIGRKLGVSTLLTGSVRKVGDRVRIVAKLVQTESGYLLWAETYDRRVEDLFAIQEEIARSIVGTLAEKLQVGAPIVSRPQPASLAAYNLYLKGRFFWNKRTTEGLNKAVECFEQAVAEDPTSSLAHAGLADAYCLLADYGIAPPGETMPRARRAALQALSLDPRSAEAHASYALIHAVYDWEWQEAEAFFRRAIELNPGYSTAHHWFGIDFLSALGRLDEARDEIDIARRLDPLSMIILEGDAYLYTLARRYDEAIAAFQGLLELDPTFYKVHTSMGRAYLHKGDYAQAITLLEKGRAVAGDVPSILGALGQAHGLAGHREEAQALLERLDELSRGRYVQSTSFALVHAGLGENGAALDRLERGAARRELSLSVLKVHPAYDSLRGEPRFAALLRRIRFPED